LHLFQQPALGDRLLGSRHFAQWSTAYLFTRGKPARGRRSLHSAQGHKETTLRAHVQWRHGDEVGVVFGKGLALTSAPVHSSDRELAQRVEKLESEIASLRKMLKRLKAELMPDADEAA
jgi:hypothetical protein